MLYVSDAQYYTLITQTHIQSAGVFCRVNFSWDDSFVTPVIFSVRSVQRQTLLNSIRVRKMLQMIQWMIFLHHIIQSSSPSFDTVHPNTCHWFVSASSILIHLLIQSCINRFSVSLRVINDFNLSPCVRACVKERLVGIKWDKLNWSIRCLLIFCFTIKVKGCYGNGIWDLPSIQLSVRSNVHLSWTGLLTYWGDPNIDLMKSEYRHIWYVCAQSSLNLTFYIKIGNFESNILYLGTFFWVCLILIECYLRHWIFLFLSHYAQRFLQILWNYLKYYVLLMIWRIKYLHSEMVPQFAIIFWGFFFRDWWTVVHIYFWETL